MIARSRRRLHHSRALEPRSIPVSAAAAIAAILGLFSAAGMATVPAAAAAVDAAVPSPTPPSNAPWTVPALQHWQAGGKDFDLPQTTLKINISKPDAGELGADADTFADDLTALTGRHVVVDTNWRPAPPPAGHGDRPSAIDLQLDPSVTGHGAEQYRATVDGDVTIRAATRAGVWDGTRTVLQLLRQSDRIPGGTADDWPAYPQRSLLIDNGRKYITPAWTEREIRELSYLKYNQMYWHITDNSGFRIQVKSHPEIVSPDNWSQQQVRDLVAYATRYHIEVIPEIEMPGHMGYALRAHPELQIVNANGSRNANNLDPTEPAARAFVKDILDELIPLFPGRYISTGGDEFTSDWSAYPILTEWARQKYGPQANGPDAVLDFTNYLDSIIRAHGKSMRIWNDGAQGGSQVTANRDIVLEYWSSLSGPELAEQFLDDGYRLVNANRSVLYEVPGSTASYNNTDPRKILEQWDMNHWQSWTDADANITAPGQPGVVGGQLHLWNDTPTAATEDQEADSIAMPLRATIQQLWGSPLADHSWDSYAAMALAVGHEPQWHVGNGSQDVALGGLAWASARDLTYCEESALVDGNDSTRWCGPKTGPQSVVIDLGKPVDLGTVVLHWETAFASGYSLEVSNDLRSWTPLHTTDHGTGGVEVLPVSGTGRYLRLAMTTRGTKYGYSLYEIRAYPAGALVPTQFSATTIPHSVLAPAGSPATSTLTVNNASAEPVTVRWTASPPSGVSVTPDSGTLELPAHGSAAAEVKVEAGAQPGTSTVPITITADSLAQQVTLAQASLLVGVPYPELSDAFNNVGVTSDTDMAPPTLGDGLSAGTSYSAEALAAAGVTPGATLTAGGQTVHWPNVPVAQPDNVVAYGQSVYLRGTGHSIGVIDASTYGPAKGSWVVHYADGTTDTVTLSTPDWSAKPPAGSTVLASMTYHNSSTTGHTVRGTYVFVQSIPVDPSKTVAAVTLPTISPTAATGAPALHVFDLTLN